MNTELKVVIGFWIVGIAFFILGAIGYIMNISKFMGMLNDPLTMLVIVRGLGIFPFVPVGAIMGWF